MAPPVVAAAAGAAMSAGFAYAAGTTLFGLTVAQSALLIGGSSLALSGLSQALTPKAKQTGASSYAMASESITRQISQPITDRRIVYGECRVSGPIVFVGSSGAGEFLHLVIVLAAHEVEEIGELIVNEESITEDMLDVNRAVQSGRYQGTMWIYKHLGSTTQTADTHLIADVPEWTSDHRLQGCAYIYVKLQWQINQYPTGIPNFSAFVKGKKVLDTRDSTTRYTTNLALIARDYLCDDVLGIQTLAADIDTVTCGASANTCDEVLSTTSVVDSITSADATYDTLTLTGVNERLQFQTGDQVNVTGASLPAGLTSGNDYYVIAYKRIGTPKIKLATTLANALAGTAVNITGTGTGTITKIAEPRYHGGGVLLTSAARGANLQEISSGMAGTAVYAGGVWRINVGEYQTPTIYFDEDDLAGPIKVQTKVTRSDRFNHVAGVYSSPINDGNPSDYPYVDNATYQTQDGGEVLKVDLDQPFTQRPHHAQRVAKIALERARQEIVFTAQFKLSAFKVQVCDNFYFTFARYGWTDKIFEVIEWTLTHDGGAPVISITARENAATVYDWNSGEETSVDPAPNTDLPDPFTVNVVVGFSIDSYLVSTQSGDKTYKVIASWDAPTDGFVTSGGKYEIQYKESANTSFISAGLVAGDVYEMEVPQLKPDVLYDLQIIPYNSFGVSGAASLIEDYLVGTTVLTNTEDWENETITARDGDDWESVSEASEDLEV